METFLLLGLIFVGVLLIGLDLSQRTWRQSDSSRSFRQSHQTNSIAYSRHVGHVREMPSLSKHAQHWSSRRKVSVEGLKQVERSQSEKLAGDYIPSNSFQPVNPAAAQWRVNHSQQVNPNFKQTYRRFSQQANPINGHLELSPPQPNNRVFKQTIKPHRKTNLAEKPTELNSPQPINPAFEETIKPHRKTKPTEKPTELCSPRPISPAFEATVERPQGAEPDNSPSGASFPQQTNSANSQTRIRSSRWSKVANRHSDSTFSIDKSKDKFS